MRPQWCAQLSSAAARQPPSSHSPAFGFALLPHTLRSIFLALAPRRPSCARSPCANDRRRVTTAAAAAPRPSAAALNADSWLEPAADATPLRFFGQQSASNAKEAGSIATDAAGAEGEDALAPAATAAAAVGAASADMAVGVASAGPWSLVSARHA